MSRKTIKLILLITGAAIALGSMGVMFSRLFSSGSLMAGIFILSIVAAAGCGLMSAALLMHSKDIWETKNGFAVAIKALAIFWIVTGALNAAGAAIVLIVYW